LGILAVAVLSAINPIEQINRGRDTSSRSDSEQLLTAMDRFNAFQGFYPWTTGPTADATLPPKEVLMDWVVNIGGSDCPILSRLGSQDTGVVGCINTDELNLSYIQRVSQPTGYNRLWVYNSGTTGASTYVCFQPTSSAFKQEATQRCGDGLPSDIAPGVAAQICADGTTNFDGKDEVMICLP
jgi:hypothetical protein